MACVRNHTWVPRGKAEHGGVGGEHRCKLEGGFWEVEQGVSVEELGLVGGEQLWGKRRQRALGWLIEQT